MKNAAKTRKGINNNLLLVLLLIVPQIVFFFQIIMFGPIDKHYKLEIAMVWVSGLPTLLILLANYNDIQSHRGHVLLLLFTALMTALLIGEGVYAKRTRNNSVRVLRVESLEKYDNYWSTNLEYTSLSGEVHALQPYKTNYYVDNNTPYRIRVYRVVYHKGKLRSSETLTYIKPYRLAGIGCEPRYKFETPISHHEFRTEGKGADSYTQEVNINESYLCLEFVKE